MKYYAINVYLDEVWLESAEASSVEEAESLLERNNPQFILNEKEIEKIVKAYLKSKEEKER